MSRPECGLFLRPVFLAAALFTASYGFSQPISYPGELGPGDAKLGRYFDTYTLELNSGERIVATLTAPEFDAYLFLESPDGTEMENDDYDEESDALIDAIIDVSGTWKIKVSSYEEGEQGRYLLTVVRESLQELDSHDGVLEDGDPVSVKGEHYDSYSVYLERNQRVVISMRSGQFDPFLVLNPPQGRRVVNDDYHSEVESRLDYIAPVEGRYELFATSYAGDELGAYSLRVLLGERMNVQEISGQIGSDDPQLEEYGPYEIHPIVLEEGQRLILEMTSQQLDTLLMVEGPGGFHLENDDYNDQTSLSRIELYAPVAGKYSILTACYDGGGEGSYTLRICSFPVSRALSPKTHTLALLGGL
jgi:hypothetical protein